MSFGRLRRAIGPLLLAAVAAACAPSASGATGLPVTLYDDAIDLGVTEVSSGSIAFAIDNRGDLIHEVEVFSGAADGQIFPVRSSIADMTGLTLIDEVENILVGSSASLVVDLPAGTYLVICNMPEHYRAGMWAYLTVEDAAG